MKKRISVITCSRIINDGNAYFFKLEESEIPQPLWSFQEEYKN